MKIASADANVRRKQTHDVPHPFSLPKTLDSSDIPITADNLALAAGDNCYFSPILVFVWGYKHYTKILVPQVPAFRD